MNDGATWSPLAETPLLGYAPMLLGDNPGYLMAVYRDLSGELPGVSLGVSFDNGRDWQRLGRLIEYTGDIYDRGYADIITLAQNQYLAVYYTCDHDDPPWIAGTVFSL
jgi:hypothetical protein